MHPVIPPKCSHAPQRGSPTLLSNGYQSNISLLAFHIVHATYGVSKFIMINCLSQQELARSLFRPASLPSVQCPYQAADSCTGFQPQSCCERLSVSGSMPSVTLHTLFILLAMICAVMALQQPTGTECLQSVHISYYVDFVATELVKQYAILSVYQLFSSLIV